MDFFQNRTVLKPYVIPTFVKTSQPCLLKGAHQRNSLKKQTTLQATLLCFRNLKNYKRSVRHEYTQQLTIDHLRTDDSSHNAPGNFYSPYSSRDSLFLARSTLALLL